MWTSDVRVLGRGVLLALVACSVLLAGQATPCLTGDGWGAGAFSGTNISLVGDAYSSFCVDDYGYSHVWYPTTAIGSGSAYQQGLNALGSSAQYLMYDIDGVRSDVDGWLSPQVWTGGGFQTPGTDFYNVIQTVTPAAGNSVHSTIGNDEVEVTITSTAYNSGMRLKFEVYNASASDITNLRMVEFFEYYPNGIANPGGGNLAYTNVFSLDGNETKGLLSGRNAAGPLIIGAGAVCGGWAPDCTEPGGVYIGAVGSGGAGSTYDVVNGGMGSDSRTTVANAAAGAMMWTYSGTLGAGQTATFTLDLVPEPATWSLLVAGAGLMLAAWRRRRA